VWKQIKKPEFRGNDYKVITPFLMPRIYQEKKMEFFEELKGNLSIMQNIFSSVRNELK
jgi:hypothetical protein